MTSSIVTGNIVMIGFHLGIQDDTVGRPGDQQIVLNAGRSSCLASARGSRDAWFGLASKSRDSGWLGRNSRGMRPRAGNGTRSIHLYI
ncbi:MAG: hypothetical protein NTAFB01_24130 [Nitrospira sp.]